MADSDSIIGQTLDGTYSILELLGEGGMGSVYKARHLGTSRLVALKVIAQRMVSSAEFVERFRREAEAAGSLRHPNVVDVTDFGFTTVGDVEVAYLVMEYLDGCALAEILAEESKLSVEWTIDIVEQICSAVDEAHRRGIVHRDLKPANIWLEPNRRGGFTVKVLDFGLAKINDTGPARVVDGVVVERRALTKPLADQGIALPESVAAETIVLASESESTQTGESGMDGRAGDSHGSLSGPRSHEVLTQVGTILGTPFYMAPEQCRGDAIDARTDIYAIGVIAYEMLAGRRPFVGAATDVMAMHVLDEPPTLHSVNPRMSRRVSDVVMSTLAKDPADRPQRAVVFASTLRANAEGFAAVIRYAVELTTLNVRAFVRVVAMAFGPLFGLRVVKYIGDLFVDRMPPGIAALWEVGVGLVLVGVVMFLAAAISRGVSALLLAQTEVAPLRRVRVALAMRVVRRRLAALMAGSVAFVSLVGIPLAVFVYSARRAIADVRGGALVSMDPWREGVLVGLVLAAGVAAYVTFRNFVAYGMFPIALLLEDRTVPAALARSRELVRRGIWYVIPIATIEIGVLVAEVLAGAGISALVASQAVREALVLVACSGLELLAAPVEAVAYAVVYLKLRQMGGESTEELLGEQFDQQELPKSQWMRRMRDRATTGSGSGSG